MVITKYISKSCIVPNMSVTGKSDALKELTHLLFEKKKLSGKVTALDQIVSREMTESTGVGRGIAVPHARIAGLKTLACAVGRIPKGLDFLAVDRKPVEFIFLIVYPPTLQSTYLTFVATLIRVMRETKNRKAMLDAKAPAEMYDILKKVSEALVEHPETAAIKVEADPAISQVRDAHPDLILLARLQLYEEMLKGTKSGKAEIRQRIEKIRSLVAPLILRHYDRLMKGQPPALVAVEADTCQGCFMRLPSKFAQQVRQDNHHIHTCTNCSRFIYVL